MIWSLVLLVIALLLYGVLTLALYDYTIKNNSKASASMFVLLSIGAIFFKPFIAYLGYNVLADEYGWTVRPNYWIVFLIVILVNAIFRDEKYENMG